MSIFENKEQLYDVLGNFFEGFMNGEDVAPKFLKKKLVICWKIKEPASEIRLAPGENQTVDVICGESDVKPSVVVELSGDTCHDFLLKKIGLTAAVASGKIKVKGSLPKVIGVVSILNPAYDLYPEHATSHGLPI